MQEVVYCNECENIKKQKSGDGYRYYCSKMGRYFPIRSTENDIGMNFCINGKLPRKEHNINNWDK